MPPCGTFDYVATVPPTAPIDGGLRIDATLREPIEHQGDELFDNRLLGYAPQLVIGWQQLVLIAAGRQGIASIRDEHAHCVTRPGSIGNGR